MDTLGVCGRNTKKGLEEESLEKKVGRSEQGENTAPLLLSSQPAALNETLWFNS